MRDTQQRVPRKSEERKIIQYFYTTFKAEGAKKLFFRIHEVYIGISRDQIQKWINTNEELGKTRPIFANKAPLKPVVANEIWGRHQIDLVAMDCLPEMDGEGNVFTCVLSVLDIFSRYLILRPMTSKQSAEVVKHLKDIYRCDLFILLF